MLNAYLAGKKLLGGEYTQFTPSGKSLLNKLGKFGKVPHKGDIIYFYSDAKELKRVCHVGGVISVVEKGETYTIKTVEGNTSDSAGFNRNGGCVAIKTYSFTTEQVGGKNRINGFCTPVFGNDTCSVEEFIKVLQDEVGYIEKNSVTMLDSKTGNAGKNNFTKYGKFFADNKLGQNGVYWCQQFISWCAYMACKKHKEDAFTGWEKLGDKWMYQVNGVCIADRWMRIGGRWYAFDGASHMITGWFKSEDSWYYLNPTDGAMLSEQWLELDDKTYYLDKNGVMATNCYIKDSEKGIYYWVNSEGVYERYNDTDSPDLATYELAV